MRRCVPHLNEGDPHQLQQFLAVIHMLFRDFDCPLAEALYCLCIPLLLGGFQLLLCIISPPKSANTSYYVDYIIT